MSDRIHYRSQFSRAAASQESWRTVAPRAEIAAQFALDDAGTGWGDEAGALQVRLPLAAR